MSTAVHILNLIYNSAYLLALGLVVVLIAALAILREAAHTWGMRWHASDACPHCGKHLEAGVGRSISTFGRLVPSLRCEGWPKCDFSTRRIAMPPPANENARQRFHHRAFD